MRKIDLLNGTGKAAKTISFDKPILDRLEKMASQQNTDVSKIINAVCKSVIMTDKEYYRHLKKEYTMKAYEMELMIKEIEAKEATK